LVQKNWENQEINFGLRFDHNNYIVKKLLLGFSINKILWLNNIDPCCAIPIHPCSKNFIIEIDKEKVVDVCFGCGFKTCVTIVRKEHYVVTNTKCQHLDSTSSPITIRKFIRCTQS